MSNAAHCQALRLYFLSLKTPEEKTTPTDFHRPTIHKKIYAKD